MSDCSTNAFKVPEGMCSCNRSRGYDDLLQRYQQLEQVAKVMLGGYRNLKDINCLASEVYEELCEHLEALGVDVRCQ